MNCEFTAILKKLADERGKEVLLSSARCKAFLSDYTCGEYKKESRLILQALEAGVQKAIDAAEDIEICIKRQIRGLQEEYFLAQEVAADVVNTLAIVLRGYIPKGDHGISGDNRHGTVAGNSNDSSGYAKRGLDYLKKNQLDAAIREFTEAIRIDPKNFSAYANRGAAHGMQGKSEYAIKDLNDAIKLNSNNSSCYVSRGAVYLNQGRYDEAIKDFNAAIKLNPDDSCAYRNRGKAYYAQDKYEFAIKDFDEAIRFDLKDNRITSLRFSAVQKMRLDETANSFKQSYKQKNDELDKLEKESRNEMEAYLRKLGME